jgi:hypothetical protein
VGDRGTREAWGRGGVEREVQHDIGLVSSFTMLTNFVYRCLSFRQTRDRSVIFVAYNRTTGLNNIVSEH